MENGKASVGPKNCSPVTPTGRMEAFSDGVFAIAITLLVLEIHVPNPEGSKAPLVQSLVKIWPAYLGYVLSFVTVGIYWVNHHYLVRLFRGTTHGLNLLNLLLLMFLCFVPFPTAVLSEYMREPGQERVAVTFFILAFVAPACAWLAMWRYAKKNELLDPGLTEEFVRHLTRQYWISPFIYLAALISTAVDYRLGLGVCIAITGLYLFPSKPPEYRAGASGGLGE